MDADTVMLWLKRGLGTIAGVVGIAITALYFLQEKLIYVPRIPGVPKDLTIYPDWAGLDYEDIKLTATDGTKLHAWLLYAKDTNAAHRRARPVILFLQENAGNMSMRLHFLRHVIRYCNCSILAPSYRGYGLSEGSPTEAGLKMDAQAALDYISTRDDLDSSKVMLLGKSLGGAVAIHLAAANPTRVRALLVENTFTSIEDVAPRVLPFLRPFIGQGKTLNFLVRNKWRNYAVISSIAHLPILLFSSLRDELLPPVQMRQLYEVMSRSDARDCTWVEFPYATHMDAYEVAQQQYWPALMQFVERVFGGQEEVSDLPGASAVRKAGSGEGANHNGQRVVKQDGMTVHHRGSAGGAVGGDL